MSKIVKNWLKISLTVFASGLFAFGSGCTAYLNPIADQIMTTSTLASTEGVITATSTVPAVTTTTPATSTPIKPKPKPPAPKPIPKPPTTVSSSGVPKVGSCQIFPSTSAYNTDISKFPLHPQSDAYIAKINEIGTRQVLHPDFGGGGLYGMPINIVGNETPLVHVNFTYGDSDQGLYRIPPDVRVQPNDDKHVVILDKDNCKLYELFHGIKNTDITWNAMGGAIWDLRKGDSQRPLYHTSADGAGMAIYPLVIKYDEVKAGAVNHAIRMTVPKTMSAFIPPANHSAGTNDSTLPPMGLRFRLKASYDISGFPPQAKIILTAMKKYGMIVAQNGSSWAFGGEQDTRWNDQDLRTLKSVPSSALEVVYTGEPIIKPK